MAPFSVPQKPESQDSKVSWRCPSTCCHPVVHSSDRACVWMSRGIDWTLRGHIVTVLLAWERRRLAERLEALQRKGVLAELHKENGTT